MRPTSAEAWRLTPALIFCFVSSVFSASAETRVGDWTVVCASQPASGCQMLQAAVGAGGAPEFLITVSREANGETFAVVTLPLKVYLAPGIEIRVDRRRPFKALFELCDEAGCHAGFRMNGPALDAFRKGGMAHIRVWSARDKAVDFPVSLKGFTQAHGSLLETG